MARPRLPLESKHRPQAPSRRKITAFIKEAQDPVLGIDGARGGWLAVARDIFSGQCAAALFPCLPELVALAPGLSAIALDMPVGLLDRALPGGRACDRAARARLGRPRGYQVGTLPDLSHRELLSQGRCVTA